MKKVLAWITAHGLNGGLFAYLIHAFPANPYIGFIPLIIAAVMHSPVVSLMESFNGAGTKRV